MDDKTYDKNMLVADAVPIEDRMGSLSVGSLHTPSFDTTDTAQSSQEPLLENSSQDTTSTSLSQSNSQSVSQSSQSTERNSLSQSNSRSTERNSQPLSSSCISSQRSLSSGSQSSREISSISYQRLDYEDMRWEDVKRYLNFNIPNNNTNDKLWKKLAISMYDKVEAWKNEQIASYEAPIWDFCIIHTTDEICQEIAEEFLKHLRLDGLIGISLSKFGAGQEILKESEKILNNSTKIFVLDSLPFHNSGLHKLQLQESLMRKLSYSDWRTKIIPLFPSQDYFEIYASKYPMLKYANGGSSSIFGLASTAGIKLKSRSETIRQVRKILPLDLQAMNESMRKRVRKNFEFSIECIKQSKCDQLSEGLQDLKSQFERLNYTTEYLARLCIECDSLPTTTVEKADQIINLQNCSDVSIGPSFHFNIRPPF